MEHSSVAELSAYIRRVLGSIPNVPMLQEKHGVPDSIALSAGLIPEVGSSSGYSSAKRNMREVLANIYLPDYTRFPVLK